MDTKMQWAMVQTSQGKLQLKQIPIPEPGPGFVLVEVHACPVNPSDLYNIKGMYDAFDVFKNPYPTVPGWEGSGMVIKSGGGMIANSLLNKRVAFTRHVDGNKCELGGTYQ
jgi:NADPH:quinone reductase